MTNLLITRRAAGCSMALTLAACAGLHPPIGTPGAMPQNSALAMRANATTYKLLHAFAGFPDGAFPRASLVDVGGTLYGTTDNGGSVYCYGTADNSCGTVFSVTTGGTETVLHSLGHRHDGRHPAAALIEVAGKLYGTTTGGGNTKSGTVIRLTTGGMEKVVYSFGGSPDGAEPQAALLDVGGTLYGTTYLGGVYTTSDGFTGGTVFSVTTGGTEKVLHSFGHGIDGSAPRAALVGVAGTLYGTTVGGGAYGRGTVFSITPSGSEKVLHSFGKRNRTDGAAPGASLIEVNGTLYGTTPVGGAYDKCGRRGACGGTVFSITPSGTEKILHSFGNGTDGAIPNAPLIEVKGKLYGTTSGGGSTSYCRSGGCGTIFSITTDGRERVLYSFGNANDGYAGDPEAGLIALNGTLYGTTYGGGSEGWGTVFSLKL
ncbi:MAG: hypothetical protein JO078_12600 [Candidatus Eremiobacteraeota bacterium]|nr:hypothetical protein [Candidatus Eremiobacteraeota bacterium]